MQIESKIGNHYIEFPAGHTITQHLTLLLTVCKEEKVKECHLCFLLIQYNKFIIEKR